MSESAQRAGIQRRAVARRIELSAALERNWFPLSVAAVMVVAASFLLHQLLAWPPHEDETLALFVGRAAARRAPRARSSRSAAARRSTSSSPGSSPTSGSDSAGCGSSRPPSRSRACRSWRCSDAASPTGATALVATVVVAASWMFLFHGVYGRMYSLFLFTSAALVPRVPAARSTGADDARGRCGSARSCSRSRRTPTARSSSRARVRTCSSPAATGSARRWPRSPRSRCSACRSGSRDPRPRGPLRRRCRRRRREARQPRDRARVPLARRGRLHRRPGGRSPVARRSPSSALVARAADPPTRAALGLRRRRPDPGLSRARASGSAASPETRHLIFVLPFFAIAASRPGILRHGAAVAPRSCVAAIGSSLEVAWAWQRDAAALRVGAGRAQATRAEASACLAATSRPDDVLLRLRAALPRRVGAQPDFSLVVLPRADAKLALCDAAAAREPLGPRRLDLRRERAQQHQPRLTIHAPRARGRPAPSRRASSGRSSSSARASRCVTPRRVPRSGPRQAMLVGKALDIGDADVNLDTIERADRALRGYGVARRSLSTSSR